MAILDQTMVLKGSTLTVTGVGLQPQADGSVLIGINGVVKDAASNDHAVSASYRASGQAQIDAIMLMMTKLLRQSAGLDDAAMDKSVKKL